MRTVLAVLVLALTPVTVASAGGGWIAFTGVQWSTGTTQLFVIRADGTGQHSLGRAGRGAADPAWSRDGTRLAFGLMTRPGWRLYVAGANGGGRRALTPAEGLATTPSFSPDGRAIAFAALPKTVPGRHVYAQQVYVVPTAGGAMRRLTSFDRFLGGAGSPAWSPDGTRIAFWGNRSSKDGTHPSIWVVRPSGSGLRRLIADASDPAWSPDGTRIAFTRGGDIYLAGADGRSIRRVTATARLGETRPSWSPDGKQLVAASMHRRVDPNDDDLRLAVMNADGTGQRLITDTNPQFWADAPAWQPFTR